MYSKPFAAVLVGWLSGVLSTCSLHFLPKLLQKIKYYDTRGILYIHALPGLLAAIVSAISTAVLQNKYYSQGNSVS